MWNMGQNRTMSSPNEDRDLYENRFLALRKMSIRFLKTKTFNKCPNIFTFL
jgi:hypothetical protein